MASNPPFQVEDQTDEDFFDKLVDDDDEFKATASSAVSFADGNDSDEAKAFANLSAGEVAAGSEDSGDEGRSKANKGEDTRGNVNAVSVDGHVGESTSVASCNSFAMDGHVEEATSLVSSSSFGFDNVIDSNDRAIVTEGTSDSTISKRNGSVDSGVKEVQWTAFNTDSGQNDGNGFGSYSDFFTELGDGAINPTVKVNDNSYLSNPDQSATGKTLDHAAAAHRKHAAMLERLSNRKQSAAPRSNSDDSFESTNSFLSRFSQSKLSIDSDLSHCSSKPDLERVSASISDLENLVAQNSYFLPSYELRSCLKSISDLKQSIENVSSQIVPKKRFAFKNKKTSSTPTPNEVSLPTESPKPSFVVSHSPGFRDMENELLVKDFKGLEMGEFSISNLSSCEVRLTGCLRALFVNRLRNCRVFTGPVLGSVLIEEVEGCMLVLASHQIRIHHAKGSDFYLRVRSRPIIEDCSAVRFAPYCLSYDGIEKDLKESNLDEETGNWANVDDFRWLKAVQSPNWSVLPENERIDRITISNLDK
ncbi:tubulin-folding cofactor C [Diospyros lotus]|uniref:tubulin-folding cofactor C n=1 Tax=Diospyros lotus TaxID=55363 RepID=UPI0022539CEF|nr:tubulin-folding cofactor C [Diospyros lotus]